MAKEALRIIREAEQQALEMINLATEKANDNMKQAQEAIRLARMNNRLTIKEKIKQQDNENEVIMENQLTPIREKRQKNALSWEKMERKRTDKMIDVIVERIVNVQWP